MCKINFVSNIITNNDIGNVTIAEQLSWTARFNDIVKRDQLASKTVILGGDTSVFRIFRTFLLHTIIVC